MADDSARERPDELEEEEGGPVKSFLEHLEDLRWVLIKSGVAAAVAMLVCLLGCNYVVKILEWPLHRQSPWRSKTSRTIGLYFGTNLLSSFHVSTNDPFATLVGTNDFTRLQIVPIVVPENNQPQNPAEAAEAEPAGKTATWTLGIQPKIVPEGAPNAGVPDIVIMSPAGAFVVATKVAFYAGLVLSSPFIFYFVAHFVFPALKMREKKYVYRGLVFGVGLFLLGVCFCYFVLMPVALVASRTASELMGFSAAQWRAEEYISFVCKFMLGMGLGFELPVPVLILVKLGILNYKMLAGARRYVIVISFILGALLTTPEVVTQVLMAVPLLALYEITLFVAWYWERQDRKREEAAGEPVHES
jgi:sec-independent protein translocase protein TatC